MKEYSIKLKSKSESQTRYQKNNFSGDKSEKAYILGFRTGDLSSYMPNSETSQIIVIRCHSTEFEQIELIESLFDKYGKVTVSSNNGHYHVNCFLDKSFKFLLKKIKIVPRWLDKDNEFGWSFTAGYFDAEANFGLNQGRGRLKVESYDKNVLYWIHEFLEKQAIKTKFYQVGKKGDKRTDGTYFNEDLWRLNVNEARSLLNLINSLGLRHKKMERRALVVKNNILDRIKKGTIK